jgi:predicted RNase H-like HicB family nuclease/uncharacterized damage-inducible protein DinB
VVDERPWSVNIEHGERWWYAHVAELPGCFARGETREEVLGALPEKITRHIAFLEARGHSTGARAVEFRVVEEIQGIPELGEAGGAVALFATDQEPVGREDLQYFLKLMRWNREELLGNVEPLSERDKEARPFPDKWTINETLKHITNAEEWYVSRLGAKSQKEYKSFIRGLHPNGQRLSTLERLGTVRRGAVHALECAFASGVQGVFTRAAYTRHPEERWTFRKVIRRFVEHEREHIGTINRVVDALAEDA